MNECPSDRRMSDLLQTAGQEPRDGVVWASGDVVQLRVPHECLRDPPLQCD